MSKHELNEFADGRLASITSIAYGRSDGMLNPECNGGRWPAGAKTRDGKLWFPTQDGVVVIDPEAIPFNAQPPPVRIESFLVDRAPVAPLRFDRPAQIAPGWENFEIEYIVLPAFYRTWWFITLAAIGVGGLLGFAWRRRVAQFNRAQAAQQAFSRQLIESQESERKRIAAELHDSLGQRLVVIKNLALMVLNSPSENGKAREQNM